MTVNSPGILTTAAGSTVAISGDLLGNTTNADDFNPAGNGGIRQRHGNGKPPQLLEAMSADLGASRPGSSNNFAYGTISLTANTSVELVDQSHNTTSANPEAVYASELIVPTGATLNLNNLHLYVRGDQISGTIVGGTVTVVSVGRTDRPEYADARDAHPGGRDQELDVLRHGGRIDHDPAQSRAGGPNPAPRPISTGARSRC